MNLFRGMFVSSDCILIAFRVGIHRMYLGAVVSVTFISIVCSVSAGLMHYIALPIIGSTVTFAMVFVKSMEKSSLRVLYESFRDIHIEEEAHIYLTHRHVLTSHSEPIANHSSCCFLRCPLSL